MTIDPFERERERILSEVVETADRTIVHRCDGDVDELLLLTLRVAMTFTEKARIMAQHVVNRKAFLKEIQKEVSTGL